MISEIRLENFQGFKSAEVRLAPVTLIFGANSSGKSSLTRAVNLISQTIKVSSSEVLYNGPLANLSSFDNVIHRHDTQLNLKLGLTFDHTLLKIDYTISELGLLEVSIEATLRDFTWRAMSSRLASTRDENDSFNDTLKIKLRRSGGKPRFKFARDASTTDAIQKIAEACATLRLPAHQLRENLSKAYFTFDDGFSPRIHLDEENQDSPESLGLARNFGSGIRQILTAQLLRHQHLGGIRSVPGRLIEWSANRSFSKEGAHAPRQLRQQAIHSKVNKWFERLTENRYEITLGHVKGVEFLGDFGLLLLEDKKLKTTTTFQDVGTGLSQILPILTALVDLTQPGKRNPVGRKAEGILSVEQPELHLHPKLQSEMGELFAELVSGDDEPGMQIIAETHSENLLLRIQKLVRTGQLDKDKVSIIYVSKDKETGLSQANSFKIDSNGDFEADWEEFQEFSNLRIWELF